MRQNSLQGGGAELLQGLKPKRQTRNREVYGHGKRQGMLPQLQQHTENPEAFRTQPLSRKIDLTKSVADAQMINAPPDECDVIVADDEHNLPKKKNRIKDAISPNAQKRVLRGSEPRVKVVLQRSPKSRVGRNNRLANSTNRDVGLKSPDPLTPTSSKAIRTRAISQPLVFVSERARVLAQMEENFDSVPAKKIKIKTRSPDHFSRSGPRLVGAGYVLKVNDLPNKVRRAEGFIGVNDRKYLLDYAVENMTELVAREHHNQFERYSHGNSEARSERAHMVDALFAVAGSLKIEDKQIVY